MAGAATDRMIGAIGAWYSASPMAWPTVSPGSSSSDDDAAAAPIAPHAPEAW
jgi:hypothetical protein